MMIRVQSLEEREEQRIAEFQERGRQLDEEYNEMIRAHNESQDSLNGIARDCELRPNQEGLVEALIEQVITKMKFGNQHVFSKTKSVDIIEMTKAKLLKELKKKVARSVSEMETARPSIK
jgi:hypothetical protein